MVNCYNFSISNDLTNTVHFTTQIPDCDCHNTAVMDLFVSHVSICSTMAFIALGNSDHVVVSKNNRGLPSFIVSSILVLIRTVLGVI